MGVPRLMGHLEAFAESVVLGCKTQKCVKHPMHQDVIIDGPSFAYYIYYRVLAHKPLHLGPMDAIPSYTELGKAALSFLDELIDFGIVVHVYFDGGLPCNKRETRKSRLEASIQKLLFSHKTYPNGFKICKDVMESPSITVVEIFNSASRSPFPSKGLPPSTFLVPAVLDALSTSPYASVTSVVLGEADLFCARAVKEHGGIILTSDSDLLLYDLGPLGAVVFLNQFKLQGAHGSSSECGTLKASLTRPSKIASRLGFDDLKYIAFVIAQDSCLSWVEARKRAEQLTRDITEGDALDQKPALEHFFNAYDTKFSNLEFCQGADTTFATNGLQESFLDPRISEFISRCPFSASMYLPFLIDDPSRTSAWDVSRQLRFFTYSCLALGNIGLPEIVFEHVRRGSRLVEDKADILSHMETIAFAQNLVDKLGKFKDLLRDSSRQYLWRLYAIHGVYSWYLEKGKTPPSKETMATAFSGIATGQLSWIEVHISAQIQAILYSLRMLNQALNYLNAKLKGDIMNSKHRHLPAGLSKLETILSTLPLLNELMPSRLELASHSLSTAEILKMMQDIRETADGPQDAFEKGCEEMADPDSFHLKGISVKRRRERCQIQDEAKKKPNAKKKHGQHSNIFNVLPSG